MRYVSVDLASYYLQSTVQHYGTCDTHCSMAI